MAKAKRQQSKSNSGCFSGIIRLMLCTGKVPTHPSSSPISDTTETKIPGPEPGPESKPGPNLVARLMGLDSLPPSTNFPQKNPSPDSFSRSRSVNFVDYLLKFDPNNDSLSHSYSHSLSHHNHRRVKTSVSFREVPSGEFIVVYLDDDDHSVKPEKEKIKKKKTSKNDNESEKKKKSKNDNDNDNEKKKKRDNKISKLKNEPRSRSKVLLPKGKGKNGNDGAKVLAKTVNGDVKPKVLKKEISEKKVTETFSRKRRNQKIVRSVENKAQNLSSVSVLEEKHSTPVNSESKTKTKSEPKTYHCNDQFELRSIEKQTNGNNRTDNKDTLDFSKLAEQLLKITKEDLNESYWISNNSKSIRDFEDICTEFERLILDVLLNEVTSEIVQIY